MTDDEKEKQSSNKEEEEDEEDVDSSDNDEDNEGENNDEDADLIELIEKEGKKEEKEEPKIIPPKPKEEKKSEEKSEKKEEKKEEKKSEEKKEEKKSEEKKEEKPKKPRKSSSKSKEEKSEEKKEEKKSEEKKEEKKSEEKKESKKEESKPVVTSKSTVVGEFLARFKKGKKLAKIIKGVAEIIGDTRIGVDERGLYILAMDGSHICLVELLFDFLDMDEFKSPSKAISIGINLVDLGKILDRASESDVITLYTNAKENKLYIKLKKEKGTKERVFTTTFIDIEDAEISMESVNAIEYTNIFSINIDVIEEAVKDASIFTEILAVGVENQILNFSAEGTTGDLHYTIGKDELKGVEKLSQSDKSSAFAIQFLNSILKINQISTVFDVKYQSEAPIVLKARLYEDNEKSGSYIKYILAPRVEEDTGTMEDD